MQVANFTEMLKAALKLKNHEIYEHFKVQNFAVHLYLTSTASVAVAWLARHSSSFWWLNAKGNFDGQGNTFVTRRSARRH